MLRGSTSSVPFSTTSDYRLKENVKPMSDVWDKIKVLKPVNFTWKKAPNEHAIDGFVAMNFKRYVRSCNR